MLKRFPFYKQHDAMQCGITCLQMICSFWGKYYTLEELSKICHANNEGVSLLGISEAASKLNIYNTCGKVSINQIVDSELPCIIFWNQNHFVVLYRVKKSRNGRFIFYIADPGRGLLRYEEEEFKLHWISTRSNGEDKGIAMFLQATPDFFRNNGTRSKEKRSFAFLLGYVKQYRRFFGQIILGLLVGCIIQLIFPFLTQAIVDVGIAYKNVSFIWLILLGQLTLVISRTFIDFIRRWLLLHISMRINISLISDFFIKLLKLPMSFFETKQMGDLIQRMNDHRRIEQFLTTQTLSVMFSILSFIVFGLVLLSYSITIFIIFLIGSVLYGVWIAIFLYKRKIIDYLLFEKQAEDNNKTYQFFTSMQEIKLQDCEQRRRWEWEDVQADMFSVQMRNLKLQQTQEAGSVFINEVKNIVITVMAATSVINGNMTLGMMLAVQYIIGQLNSPVEQLMSFLYSLQDVKISLERINEIHEMSNEERENESLTKIPINGRDIQLKSVEFKYGPHSLQKTINEVNFVIPSGKVTAIVDYDLKWWRRQCGVVMQDGILFSESIARNIAVSDGDINPERLVQAARIANVENFILSLPLKYNTLIGRDGVGLSQGQKQRVLIARAVYKNPEYIFLDEATNALDANNERVIVENLNDFYKGKTVVVVAHRLSTVKNADQIVVIENGAIIEIGNHCSLIEKQGAYFNLVKNQLELGS